MFCKNLRTTWLHQILGSFRRVQLVPLSFLSWFTNVSFAWRWLIEIEKCSSRLLKIYIWKIWMRIKWEAWGEIYLKYLDADKMRGKVETFLFPILHWAWPIVQCMCQMYMDISGWISMTYVSTMYHKSGLQTQPHMVHTEWHICIIEDV